MSNRLRGGYYGSIGTTRRKSKDITIVVDFDPNGHEAAAIDTMNEGLIAQIRQQTLEDGDGPFRSKFQKIARSRRRPILRTKSESDFLALMSEDVEKMRERLVRGHSGRNPTFLIKKVPKFTGQQKMVLISLALVEFTSFCAMSILAPFFPSEATRKGMSTSVSGFIFSVYALIVFIASPFMGGVVGRVGPKFLLIMGVGLGGFCNILFGLLDRVESTLIFTIYCFAVRIFEALGAAAFATASYTFVAQIFPDNLGVVLGILETFVGLGMSFGPAIGGFLYDWGGYGLPFFSLGCFMLLTIPVNYFLLPSTSYDENDTESPGSMFKLFNLRPIIVVSLVIIVASNTWGFLDPTLEPHLREFNLSAKQIGLFFLLLSLLYALSSPGWGYLADKMTRTWIMMVIGLLLSAGGLLLLGPSPIIGLENSIWLNVVSLIILGTFISMALLPTFEAMLDFAIDGGYRDETSTYGLIAGLWSSMYSLGEVIGPTLGAFLTDHFGFPVCASVMAGICVVLAIIVLIYFLSIHHEDSEYSTWSSKEGRNLLESDSGISENETDVISSSYPSSQGFQYIQTDEIVTEDKSEIDEKTPLLSRSLDGSSFLAIKQISEGRRSSWESNWIPPPHLDSERTDPDSSHGFNYSISYPEVLKTISITAYGAVEV